MRFNSREADEKLWAMNTNKNKRSPTFLFLYRCRCQAWIKCNPPTVQSLIASSISRITYIQTTTKESGFRQLYRHTAIYRWPTWPVGSGFLSTLYPEDVWLLSKVHSVPKFSIEGCPYKLQQGEVTNWMELNVYFISIVWPRTIVLSVKLKHCL